jgi:peptidoglycan/LPS O-acetylase OafA/YrhL
VFVVEAEDVESDGGLAAKRNTQIDGWRAFAVLGVMWHHWAPRELRGALPFEIGLFFFLTLTGFLITRILLKDRESAKHRDEAAAGVYAGFLRRRFGRILLPCVVAMVFAMVFGARDIREHPGWYFFHLSNYHMAVHEAWPSGTAPFWTLAIQMQFYVVWPLLVLWLPRGCLPYVFASGLVLAPVSRWVFATWCPWVYHSEAIPLCALDYFGAGGLLAWALAHGWPANHRIIKRAAILGWAAYALIYGMRESGLEIPVIGLIQQTCLAIGLAGLIGLTLHGFKGWRGRLLEHPGMQHVGRISYGLYLFHALVPLFLGYILPFLWMEVEGYEPMMLAMRMVVFALVSWGIAWLCWRWLEGGEVMKRK